MFFFYLKKIIARALFPVPLVLELVLLGALLLRWNRTLGRRLIVVAFLLLYAFSLPVTGDALLGALENRYDRFDRKELDGRAAITIGVAGSGFDLLPGSDSVCSFNDHSLVRLQEAGRIAAELESAGLKYRLVVGVWNDHLPDEVKRAALEDFYSSFGLPAERLVLVTDACNSQQEVSTFLRYPGNVIVVSQAFHLPRLMMLADRLRAPSESAQAGRRVFAAPAGRSVLVQRWTALDLVPSADALNRTQTAMYEWLGMAELVFGDWSD